MGQRDAAVPESAGGEMSDGADSFPRADAIKTTQNSALTETLCLTDRYHIRANKRYGQNFLTDDAVFDEIIAAADIGKEDRVLEIGAGLGQLTKRLCETAGDVLAVEIDDKMLPVLDEVLEGYENVRVIHADILETDIEKIIADAEQGARPVKVVANLPYYITTPILMRLFETTDKDGNPLFQSITVMVQREVAERMQAKPATKDYGALTLTVEYYAKAEIISIVPPEAFLPAPEVESAIVRLTMQQAANGTGTFSCSTRHSVRENAPAPFLEQAGTVETGARVPTRKRAGDKKPISRAECRVEHEIGFASPATGRATPAPTTLFRIIRAAFNQRRKTLANALKNAPNLTYTKEEIETAIQEIGKEPTVRGEVLTLSDFINLTERLEKTE